MASGSWFVMPPAEHISKKYAAWLRSRNATINGKVPRATRKDKGLKREKKRN